MNGQWTGGIDVEVGLDTCLDTSVTAVSSLLCTAMNIQHAEECTVSCMPIDVAMWSSLLLP